MQMQQGRNLIQYDTGNIFILWYYVLQLCSTGEICVLFSLCVCNDNEWQVGELEGILYKEMFAVE